MNDGDQTFAITFGTVYFLLSCCWLTKKLLKSRPTIRPLGMSRIISTISSLSSSTNNNSTHTNFSCSGVSSSYPGYNNFSGNVLFDNYVNSNIVLPVENSHVIIQIVPEPITPPYIAIGIPIHENYSRVKNV